VVPEKAEAILTEGVLEITAPKAEKAKPIEVKAA
jgi:HSP20 family molecular chaperone IbpA